MKSQRSRISRSDNRKGWDKDGRRESEDSIGLANP